MLVLFRIFFTGLFVWLMTQAAREAQGSPNNDLGNAGNFALVVIVGLVAGLTWAPVLGETVSGPLTGLMTDGSVSDDRTALIRFVRRCEQRGWRRVTRWLAFWECVLHPKLPGGYVIGMNNARPGSWLERVFAREVWKFNHIGNCVRAHDLLKLRHGENPGVHPQPEVNLALMAHVREPHEALPPLAVPAAPSLGLPARKAQIQLFKGAGSPTPAAGSPPTDPAAVQNPPPEG